MPDSNKFYPHIKHFVITVRDFSQNYDNHRNLLQNNFNTTFLFQNCCKSTIYLIYNLLMLVQINQK